MQLQEVQQKARYGHRDWLFWTDKAGNDRAERRSADAIKSMLLDTGTHGKWYLVSANSGSLMRGFWWLGLNILRQARRGYC